MNALRMHCISFLLIWAVNFIVSSNITTDEYKEIVRYMQRYGYIDDTSNTSPTNEQFRAGMKLMQKYAGIPITGTVDEKVKASLKLPRCGVRDTKDAKETREIKPYLFDENDSQKRELKYYVLNSSEKFEEETVVTLLTRAFNMYQRACGVMFFLAMDILEADVVITFYRSSSSSPGKYYKEFDGPGGILANFSVPKNRSTPIYINFDGDEMWMDETQYHKFCKGGTGFLTVALHEIGHVLGLSHTHDRNSIMHPYFRKFTSNVRLGYTDALSLYNLYVGSLKISGNLHNLHIVKPNPIDYFPNPHCDEGIDAALTYYDQLYLFKGKSVWRMWRNEIVGDRSFWISQLFHFPEEVEKIDAAYHRRTDGKVLFFTGNQYWIFDYIYPSMNYSLSIYNLGFPKEIGSIDAAMQWAGDENTYFFKNDQYWCYNEVLGKMKNGYPLPIKRWKHSPKNLDASASFRNGTTYFFKGTKYWEVDGSGSLINHYDPYSTTELLKCDV